MTLLELKGFNPSFLKEFEHLLTIGKLSLRAISAKSSFLSLTCDCPAAKWLQTKQRLDV